MSEIAMLRQLSQFDGFCAGALGDLVTSGRDFVHRQDAHIRVPIGASRLSEEQYPPLETQHSLRR